jgi:outer membrane immunogenic protein
LFCCVERIMKKFFVASVGLFALGSATQALAADMKARPYTKAPPPAIAPVYDWSGFYVGGNVGYGVGRDASSETAVSGEGFPYLKPGTSLYGGSKFFDVSTRGVIGGGQIGYNWQASPAVVFGVETDIQASDIKGSTGCIVTCGTGVVTVPMFSGFPSYSPTTRSGTSLTGSEQCGEGWDIRRVPPCST